MRVTRRFAVRHARFFERLYELFSGVLLRLHPLLQALGYQRLERPVVAIERQVKGLLFDCRMCGQCVLSSTGMSCPTNCPKSLRNGPCGGVRPDGNCEVIPDMPCVWVDAVDGSRRMRGGDAIQVVQAPLNQCWQGSSSWLRVTREAGEARAASRRAAGFASTEPPRAGD